MRVERGAEKGILVPFLPLETITQSVNGAPPPHTTTTTKLVRYCGVRIRLEIRFYGCDGAVRAWLWVCGAVRGALQESAALPSEHHRRVRILGVPRSRSLRSLRPAVSQPGDQQRQQQQQHRASTVGSSCSGLHAAAGEGSQSNSEHHPPLHLPPYPVNTSLRDKVPQSKRAGTEDVQNKSRKIIREVRFLRTATYILRRLMKEKDIEITKQIQ